MIITRGVPFIGGRSNDVPAGGGGSTPYLLAIVAGQSNARSYDTTGSDVVSPLDTVDTGRKIWNTHTNAIETYDPGGNSDTWNSGASTPQKWGPEAAFGYYYRQANPSTNVLIVKIAVDSTELAANAGSDWSPTTSELFDDMTAEITAALAAAGSAPIATVLLWMQGEHDALNSTFASDYEDNLTDFITAVRTDWGDSSTEVIIGRISASADWTFGATVRAAQVAVAGAVSDVEIVDTDGLPLAGDDRHYTAAGVATLGEDMYDAYAGTYVHAPTDIALSADDLGESAVQGYAIGTLSAIGGFAPYTFSLLDSAGNKVQISGSALQAGSTSSGAEGTTFDIEVRVTDAVGSTYDEVFTINVVEAPIGVGSAVIWSGNGSSRSITGVGFSPDLVAIKARNATTGWRWTDNVRGATKSVDSGATSAEATETGGLTSFDGDGFSLGTDADYNANSVDFLALCFQEVSAAFDIVTYTGNGTGGRTVSHGLGVTPEFMIVRNLTTAGANWAVYTATVSSPGTRFLQFQTTAAIGTSSTVWNDTAPTSSVFSVGTSSSVNTNTNAYVAWLFASKAGATKIGSYTGNGTSTGPYVTTGFRPRFVLIKRTSATGNWVVFDDARDATSPHSIFSLTNTTAVEATTGGVIFDATGFQITGTDGAVVNTNAVEHMYLAVA